MFLKLFYLSKKSEKTEKRYNSKHKRYNLTDFIYNLLVNVKYSIKLCF